MSYDVWLTARTEDGVEIEVFDGNMTSNCAPAWDAAGCPLRDFDGARAGDLAPFASAASLELASRPEYYRPLVRGDGSWGTPETAHRFISAIAEACHAHPSALVRVSR